MDGPSCYNCELFSTCWFRRELDRLISKWPMLRSVSDGYKKLHRDVAQMCEAYEYGLSDPPATLLEKEDEDDGL